LKNIRSVLSEANALYSEDSSLAYSKVSAILERLVHKNVLDETEINALGYRYLWVENEPAKARLVFEFNKEKYPYSYNVYGSLADSYVSLGLIDLAIDNYEMALVIEPSDNYSKFQLAKLKNNKK